jgi:hypothetical protein
MFRSTRRAILTLVISLVLASEVTGGSSGDLAAVAALVVQFARLFNAQDEEGLEALLSPDPDPTTGKTALPDLEAFISIWARKPTSTSARFQMKILFIRIRFIRFNAATVDFKWELFVEGQPYEQPPIRRGLINWTVTRRQTDWFIISMRNTDLPLTP